MNSEENEKTKDKGPVKPGRSSRLGHEAKIGVAVILSLLTVLVAVVVVRLSSAGSGEKAVAAVDRDAGKHKPADRTKDDKPLKDDKLFQDFKAKPFAAAGPTVVPAKAAVIGPPKAIDANPDPWKLASDKPEVKRPSGGELPPSSPPLLMPEPSKPLSAGQQEQPPSEPPSRYGALKRGEEGGFSSAGDRAMAVADLPAAVPPRREDKRRDDSKAIPPPLPPPSPPHRDHTYAGSMDRSAPVTPVSEIEAGAVRRDPPVPRYGGDESRRRAPAPSYHSGKSYTVVEGDTLFNIARYELGKASRWVEIYELNHDVLGKDFNYLTPGMKLVLPEGDRPDVIAQPPSGTYRR